jgi:hypothetical protein
MSLTSAFDNYVLNPKKFPVIYYLFDDRALHAHIKKLQGAIEAPSTQRRERRTPLKEPSKMFTGRCKMFSPLYFGGRR